MDDKEKKLDGAEDKGVGSLKVSRRGFLKGVGTGTVTVAMTGVPFVLPSESWGAQPAGVKEAIIRLNVNGADYRLKVKSHWTLLEVLRKELGLTGTKKFCDRGSCGACTVIMEGMPIYACSRLAIEADNKRITTIEGLSEGEKVHPIQEAFMQHDGLQCGFCTPGFIMSVKALADKNPRPSSVEMKEALSGNVCRCAAYPKILESAMAATRKG